MTTKRENMFFSTTDNNVIFYVWLTHTLQRRWKMKYEINGVSMHTLVHIHQSQEE